MRVCENDDAIWMPNPNKKSILRLLKHQPQVGGVSKIEIVYTDDQCY